MESMQDRITSSRRTDDYLIGRNLAKAVNWDGNRAGKATGSGTVVGVDDLVRYCAQ